MIAWLHSLRTKRSYVIVITAPTSTIGRHLVTDLLDGGAALRLVARDPLRTTPTTFRQWCEEVLKPAVAA